MDLFEHEASMSTQGTPGQQTLYRKTMSQKTKQRTIHISSSLQDVLKTAIPTYPK